MIRNHSIPDMVSTFGAAAAKVGRTCRTTLADRLRRVELVMELGVTLRVNNVQLQQEIKMTSRAEAHRNN